MSEQLKNAVQKAARALGFSLCRVTDARPPDPDQRLRQWLQAGFHGEMQWMARSLPKREDLQAILSEVRSVVCVAAAYPAPPAPPPAGAGFVARYARGADYHQILGGKLAELAALLNREGGAGTRSLWYVDTGPILERALAQRAGIGFIGKHSQLINRHHGNWLLLGEILTTVALPPDTPERNRCGTCTRCLAACPTRAITAPFTLDARRCISYLTIELKGAIPEELRPLIGTRIFGCDDCLEVCPWNRFAGEASPLLQRWGRQDLQAPDLLELLQLDEAGFRQRFQGTPLQRSKRRGLLRNVCVALGNLGRTEALPFLEKAVQDPEPLIAEHARWAIKRIQTDR
ncbi:tRNA epoxyqueuosine(34) reductase QueG [Fontisphaera persica]|uniref:tRNA epoxyqueuosine(34) reductase QueG n=1 Tax=Fontisphaera persica TaxID=2974023 RepID=UPI0024BF6004|nr:tRNA epoxyqueuosine(34) reductase QueG [Fontisphaera persica]WCJ60533.1 tRNA epoxyqueuosine(34) reductase QueG [Fontisphaera persica]